MIVRFISTSVYTGLLLLTEKQVIEMTLTIPVAVSQ